MTSSVKNRQVRARMNDARSRVDHGRPFVDRGQPRKARLVVTRIRVVLLTHACSFPCAIHNGVRRALE